jgi:hypothetical protein
LNDAERGAPRENVGHVHVDRLESGAIESRAHLDLAVHALLAQHREARARTRRYVRRFRGRIVCKGERKAGIGCVEHTVELFLRALRVVTQRLHSKARLGPCALQVDPLLD